jgi:hypothetical protein
MYVLKYKLEVKRLCTWYILLVHKMVCLVCTQYIPVNTFFLDLVLHFSLFCRVHTGTYLGFSEYILCTVCSSCVFCGPAGRFMHWNTHSTKAHYIRFINCCLAAPLPVPASAIHHNNWALALACCGMQLRRVSFARLAVVKLPR